MSDIGLTQRLKRKDCSRVSYYDDEQVPFVKLLVTRSKSLLSYIFYEHNKGRKIEDLKLYRVKWRQTERDTTLKGTVIHMKTREIPFMSRHKKTSDRRRKRRRRGREKEEEEEEEHGLILETNHPYRIYLKLNICKNTYVQTLILK